MDLAAKGWQVLSTLDLQEAVMIAVKYPTCPSSLTQEQVEQFHRDGYLAFHNVLTPEEVEAAQAGLSELITMVAKSPNIMKKGTFWAVEGKRIVVSFERGYVPQDAETEEIELKVRKLMYYQEEHPHFDYLVNSQPKIQGVLESLIGREPILYADQALVKPAHIGSEKPWHQDDAYFIVTPLEAVCGVWIALEDATIANGCMHVLPGQHKRGALLHHHTFDCEIVPDRIDPSLAVPVELPAGGAMFFSGLLPHQTPPNTSPDRRRALQFHYRSADSTLVTREEYNDVFVEADGTRASCYATTKMI
jgi:phytanoyl-CoA hydroxylase